jgi:hypothetical protein
LKIIKDPEKLYTALHFKNISLCLTSLSESAVSVADFAIIEIYLYVTNAQAYKQKWKNFSLAKKKKVLYDRLQV